jgi:hypothetical protein
MCVDLVVLPPSVAEREQQRFADDTAKALGRKKCRRLVKWGVVFGILVGGVSQRARAANPPAKAAHGKPTTPIERRDLD